MFSTFTGSSRRPRNVNLSGQAGNPFASTSWSPAKVSNATKTVSDAQAEREKRQAERQRVKATTTIQRVWKGHRARMASAESWRGAFDDIYSPATGTDPARRLPEALTLLLAFFSTRRADDVRRACLFCSSATDVPFERISPPRARVSQVRRLTGILVGALQNISSGLSSSPASSPSEGPEEVGPLLKLITRITLQFPGDAAKWLDGLYSALAELCRVQCASRWGALVEEALVAPLAATCDNGPLAYRALTFSFLARPDLVQFEDNIEKYSARIDAGKLSRAIQAGFRTGLDTSTSRDDLLWLLAHFIDLYRHREAPPDRLEYLGALLPQLSFLSSDIAARSATETSPEASPDDSVAQSFPPYVSQQLSLLVDQSGLARLLRDFSECLAQTSNQEFQGTSALAGYILTLLRVFPESADDIRMRLFLEQMSTASGDVPTVKFLWHIMKQTSVFRNLQAESENPTEVLCRYLHGSSQLLHETAEEQEWRIVLLFLELYIFILRLSDDEDFFSGMSDLPLETNSSTPRLRSCGLSLKDLEALTVFLKNTAFTLHYKSNELSLKQRSNIAAGKPHSTSYLSLDGSTGPLVTEEACLPMSLSPRIDLDGLRTILTTALRMVYERDSRKRFLPPDHWLMTHNLEQEDFISAVIAEEERQSQEGAEESENEADEDVAMYDAGPGVYSTVAGQRLSRHARLERLKAEQMRSQRERRLAEMGPKLEILKHMPFVVPFDTRVGIFRQFIYLDRRRREMDNPFYMFPPNPSARHHAKIRRGQLFDDAYEQFYQLGEGLKDPIQITFVDQFDTPEAGIDGGGVTKEFLTSVTAEAFQSDQLMFTSNEQGLLFPNPTMADARRDMLRRAGLREDDAEWKAATASLFKRLEFLGRIVGKCMYEGILVDLAFAGFFLLKWPSAGPKEENTYKGSINDLRDMDEELYKGMLRLKNYAGDVADLGLDFTVDDQISLPGQAVRTVTRKLIYNGDQTPVTNDNRLLYISYMARHRLVVQPALQTQAFLRGLRAIIKPSWLSMFNQSELQRLVGGDSSEIDIDDLRRNTVYSGLYEIGDDNEEHPTIKMFWRVMEGFTDAQRRDVLKYVSSTPRAPLLGFSQLRPKFSIRDGGTDEDRLPSTSTCVNLLKLPRYKKEATLREKLLYAVTSGAGFDLS